MATKSKAPTTQFVCSNCGFTAPKWLGKCPDCGNFNTMQEEIVRVAEPQKNELRGGMYRAKTRALPLSEVGYEKFQAEVDMLSRLHLLLPVTSRIFHYLAFNYEGETLESSYWRVSETVPALIRSDKNGYVKRMGGVPARPGIDFVLPDRIGRISVSQILDESVRSKRPARYSGTVDLGKGVMADAPGTRTGE